MSNYPDGAVFDSRAPWNQKESRRATCPCCKGEGYIYHLMYYDTWEVKVVPAEEYYEAMSEEEAEDHGKGWFQFEKGICEACKGAGEIDEEEEEFNPFSDIRSYKQWQADQ